MQGDECPIRKRATNWHGWHRSECTLVAPASSPSVSASFRNHQVENCHRYRCLLIAIHVAVGCLSGFQVAWAARDHWSSMDALMWIALPVLLKLVHGAVLFTSWWTRYASCFMVFFEAAQFFLAIPALKWLATGPTSAKSLPRVLLLGSGAFSIWWYGVMLPKPAYLDYPVVLMESVTAMVQLSQPTCSAVAAVHRSSQFLPSVHQLLDNTLGHWLGADPAPYSCVSLICFLHLVLAGAMLCFKAHRHHRAYAAFTRASMPQPPPSPHKGCFSAVLVPMLEKVVVAVVLYACAWQLVRPPRVLQ